MAFQTTSDLLSEIASDYMNKDDDLSGAGRKIELKDNLVVMFNNKASQVNPAFRMLVLGLNEMYVWFLSATFSDFITIFFVKCYNKIK